MNTPVIPSDAFSGQKGITEGTGADGVGDLASILQNVRLDLAQSNSSLSATEISSTPLQVAKFDIAGGATVNKDVSIPSGVKIRVVDVQVINKGLGTASDTVQAKKKNGGTVTNISNAISINAADQTIARASTIDDANYDLDGTAGDELRVTLTDGGGADVPAVQVLVSFITIP